MSFHSFKCRCRWSVKYCLKTILELFVDLARHFLSAYPVLLIMGAWRRLRRRLRSIWLPKSKGRPPIPEFLLTLILEMKRENQSWGGQRISDELRYLGYKVSKRSVLRILQENGYNPPKKKFDPPGWKALWDVYSRIWGIDFICVYDLAGTQLFIFNILDWGTRKLIVCDVTSNPTALWLQQQLRNASIETCDNFPCALVRDSDAIFGKWLDHLLKTEFHVDPIPIQVRSPWQNGRTERVQKSEKYEILNRIPIIDESHCRDLIFAYRDYYNSRRPHQELGGCSPNDRDQKPSHPVFLDPTERKIKKMPAVMGLITFFESQAA